ncbi:unnamed protein product [Allacma fusca]|uniref:Protein zer-1 homolog n=1 Tax=Allacma fusca TaxID=39272 RepID=A0A8J2NG62_9HEXA|nr:unnamed protein product [Allacma fusca]
MGGRYCNDPDSLLNICIRYCLDNLTVTLADYNPVRLKPNTFLPKEICEKMLEFADKDSEQFDTHILPLFQDTTCTRLDNLNLRNSNVSDESLEKLMAHHPVNLDIHNCPRLTPYALDVINRYSGNLKSLVIGNTTQILPETLVYAKNSNQEGAKEELLSRLLTTRKLLKLVIWGISMQQEQECYMTLLTKDFIETIQFLDVSSCVDIASIDFLTKSGNLTWLSLYNVMLKGNAFAILGQLKQLRHLDISQSSDNNSIFREPNELLSTLVTSLPKLTSLDISGTNLAGRGVQEKRVDEACDIPGLNSRIHCPLEFLGLYGTHHDASHRHHIPAKRIAGDRDESQILTACQAYLDRHELLEKVLNDLFHLFRGEKGTQVDTALRLILTAMSRHIGEKHVQISGSASLFYIVKNEDKSRINPVMKRAILSTLINAMEVHKFDPTMMRNGCLTICHFQIPLDVLFNYEKLVRLLLEILGSTNLEEFVERIAIYLLNSLACQVEGEHKKLVGDLGAITKMLHIIEDRLSKHDCDDVMEIAWSTMWNVTDERPENCERFLTRRGMELFLKCLNAFPNKPELRRNMMGLLGNVAEVKYLRPQLMTTEFINVFYHLLDSTQDNIEVSYNAAGVLAHVLSDGVAAWTIVTPWRTDVLESIRRNIKRWDVNSNRNINYR